MRASGAELLRAPNAMTAMARTAVVPVRRPRRRASRPIETSTAAIRYVRNRSTRPSGAQIADIPGLQNRPEAGVAGGAKIKVSEIGLFWFATRAERGDSPVTSMFQTSGATVVSIDGPRIAALAQFLL